MRDLVDVDWPAEHLHDDALVVVDASMAPPGSSDPLPVDDAAGLFSRVPWDASAIVDADVTAAALASGAAAVLDARSPSRFTGVEPDPRKGIRAGHMPGARSLHYATVAPGGRMLPVDQLDDRLRDAAGERPIVASCGSGVTAAVLALAATLTGREATVYDGSWSEWGRADSGRAIVTGD